MTPERRMLSVAGTQTPLLEAGPSGASEAMLFVHGNPGSGRDWAALLQAAGAIGRAVAFDMPGFGKAHAPAGFGFDVQAYADFIEAARVELGIERVHLVLHDFGGPFGMAWGTQHPERWASVALLNIGILPGYEWHSLAKRWRTPVLGELSQAFIPRAGWRRVMQRSNPKGLPPGFVDQMYDDYDRETRSTVLRLYRNTPDPGTTSDELGPAIRALDMPALVIWGAKDQYLGVEYAERQREFFDVEEVAILPESGHWPFQDDPERVREVLVPYLQRRLARSPAGSTTADG